ncbi:RNA-directed DNA polymerase from mobile element jockey [Mizuhopecten yessoensis]|uniref:RNA-directed DNA polymerase from mobile element jockey n=1 Tax=Mizuhopecten yessoensis TaxID=6573 RepID=A0A210PXX7_MIZYE|nr:RNA-directed DNA polymerase from mobile element jockey [Mizuhopecten yessoensis]
MYLKLFVILYADGTVLMAETPEGLQHALSVFQNYCRSWKLTINVQKTKVVIFEKRDRRQQYVFKLNEENIEVQNSYSYLGILFDSNGTFSRAKTKITEQAKKALYALNKKIRNIPLSVDLQLKLFDSLVSPILLYACEILGFKNTTTIERMHLQFCKRIMNVKNSTPNYMIYGETGRYPLEIEIKTRMIMFWFKLLTGGSKISSLIYKMTYVSQLIEQMHFKWNNYIKDILNKLGFSNLWIFPNTCTMNRNYFKAVVKQRLKDQFIQKWFQEIENSSRGKFYSIFKTNFQYESYLTKLNEKDRKLFVNSACLN